MGEVFIIEQSAEGFQPDGSLADVLMAIEFRSACGLGVIHVPHAHIRDADSRVDPVQRFSVSVAGHKVVSSNVAMAGVEASPYWCHWPQAVDELCHLFKTATKRKLRARCIFDKYSKVAV